MTLKNELRLRAIGQLIGNLMFIGFIGFCLLMVGYAITCAILAIWGLCHG